MFCTNCGAAVPDDARFCEQCGSPVAAPEKEKEPVTIPEKKGKAAKKNSNHTALSVMLCILIVFLGSFASVIFLTRYAVSEGAVENLIKNLELSDLRMGFTEEGDGSQTLADYIVENQDSLHMLDIEKEKIEELLNEKFIRKFVTKKAADYVEDLFSGTGDGVISAKELQKLWTDNADTIYEITRAVWSDEELRMALEKMEADGVFDITDLSLYREENPGAFLLVKSLLSYWMGIALLIFAVLLAVSIFLIQEKMPRGLSFLGSGLIAIGAVNLLAGILGNTFASLINESLSLGRSFWEQMFGSVRTAQFITAVALIAAGIISWVTYIIIKSTQKKKAVR